MALEVFKIMTLYDVFWHVVEIGSKLFDFQYTDSIYYLFYKFAGVCRVTH